MIREPEMAPSIAAATPIKPSLTASRTREIAGANRGSGGTPTTTPPSSSTFSSPPVTSTTWAGLRTSGSKRVSFSSIKEEEEMFDFDDFDDIDDLDPVEPTKGQVYWIRHGESEGNEKNIFSGVVDFRLTRYGELQGKRARYDLEKKFGSRGGQFDAVYTSNLYRAIRTKQLALREDEEGDKKEKPDAEDAVEAPAIKQPKSTMVKTSTEQIIATELCERSQGIFTGESKALIMSLFGRKQFDAFLSDSSHCPLGGESGGEIYDRCKAFYQREIEPRTLRGENVLIVCHEFVMMGMVCYLAGGTRDDFVEFKVPNGKALSNNELMALLDTETDAFNDRLKEVGNWTIVNALRYAILLYTVGGIIRIASGSSNGMPTLLFRILIVGLNFVSSLYTYLDVDLAAVSNNISWVAVISVSLGVFIVRWIIALYVVNFVVTTEIDSSSITAALNSTEDAVELQETSTATTRAEQQAKLLLDAWMLWLMIPPGMTSPAVAKLLGGNVYESATLAPPLGVLLPLLLRLGLYLGWIPIHAIDAASALTFYWTILAGGLWFPCFLSQVLRWYNPVETAKHTKRWNFLAGWSFMGLGLVGGYQTAPTHFFQLLRDINSTAGTTYSLAPMTWAFGIWIALRISAMIITTCLRHTSRLVERQLVDIFVLTTTPNFFLWLALAETGSSLGSERNNTEPVFWAGFFFFGGIAFEQLLAIIMLGYKLCQAAVGGTVISAAKVDELVDRFDSDGNQRFDAAEFQLLLKHFYRNSGEPVPEGELLHLLTRKMMKHMGMNERGEVPVDAVRAYLKGNGLYVNLNSAAPWKTDSTLIGGIVGIGNSIRARRRSSERLYATPITHSQPESGRLANMIGALVHGGSGHSNGDGDKAAHSGILPQPRRAASLPVGSTTDSAAMGAASDDATSSSCANDFETGRVVSHGSALNGEGEVEVVAVRRIASLPINMPGGRRHVPTFPLGSFVNQRAGRQAHPHQQQQRPSQESISTSHMDHSDRTGRYSDRSSFAHSDRSGSNVSSYSHQSSLRSSSRGGRLRHSGLRRRRRRLHRRDQDYSIGWGSLVHGRSGQAIQESILENLVETSVHRRDESFHTAQDEIFGHF